ncbi:MAG: aminoacyl-tRNA hydrolase [Flavobacteriales bacterium]|nr:aminoacyl-tRNA hydrolase [Flavobacteriales bacterium]MBK7554533.1 aminoacyl-tRNA hydrolase [Flavobacteriales bacterium]MBK9195059.1 aminoacyl-tRNA hydrolase [Flavobacteriales bacterium]MBP6573122.1 aminoacyl-tRNA hydrolase [Flavobacteriales bacterium]
MKYMIVGLGNPGPEYVNTRHNIGFQVLDTLAKTFNASFESDRYAEVAEVRHKGRTFILAKPQTFMNLSGKAVRYWMEKENVPLDRVLVVTDDLALPFGKIRLRASGSAGGHNGLTSIIEVLGSLDFARLRFGIGADFPRGRQAEHVLSPWTVEEGKTLEERTEIACKAVLQFGLLGIAHAMNNFNTR